MKWNIGLQVAEGVMRKYTCFLTKGGKPFIIQNTNSNITAPV